MKRFTVTASDGSELSTNNDSIEIRVGGRRYLIVDMGTGIALSTQSDAEIVVSNKRHTVRLNGGVITVHS